jgi:hypothetical protein
MGEEGVPVGCLEDDVIASQEAELGRLPDVEGEGELEKEREVSSQVYGIPLWPTILSFDDRAGPGRVDGLAPAVAIPQSRAEK